MDTLRCEIIWNDLDVLKNVDNGHRLVDKDGEHVLVGPDGEGHVEGEIEFKWVFYAQVGGDDVSTPDSRNEGSTPDTSTGGDNSTTTPNSSTDSSNNGTDSKPDDGFFPPYTGILMKDGKVWLISMGVIGVMIAVLIVLIKKKEKKK